MPASIDALVDVDPAALDAAGLRAHLVELGRARARVDAAEAMAIALFDEQVGYLADGMVNARAWLAHHTGVSRAVAGSRVLLARRLRRMPLMAAALAEETVTHSHARSLARCLTPRTTAAFCRDERLLVDTAMALEADDFDLVVTRWLFLNDPDGVGPGRERLSELHVSPMLGGRTRVDGELDVEDSAEFLAELEARYDELWRQDRAAGDGDALCHRTRGERMAAALVEMARRSSAAGDNDADADDPAPDGRPGSMAPLPRKPQLVVVVDLDAIAGEVAGLSVLDDGNLLPQHVLQRWLCDSSIGRVVMAGSSVPVDLGRLTYTVSAGQRRALVARDRGCIVPGCKRKARWCEAHHVVPWPTGPTDLDNLVLLCKRHHKQVHALAITLQRDPVGNRWIVTDADRVPLRQRPPPLAA
jgi:hypothetical protein